MWGWRILMHDILLLLGSYQVYFAFLKLHATIFQIHVLHSTQIKSIILKQRWIKLTIWRDIDFMSSPKLLVSLELCVRVAVKGGQGEEGEATGSHFTKKVLNTLL